MSIGFVLVNHTRREVVSFAHLPASTARELAGNSVTSAITTWYLLHHRDDKIAFVSDTLDDWPFPSGSPAELGSYMDATSQVIEQLIHAGILRDDGIAWADEDEPQSIYIRALSNVWTVG